MRRAALVAALLLAGCGNEVDSDDLEGKVAKLVEQNTGERVKVDCPEGQSAKKGTKIRCRASGSLGEATVTVEVLDDQRFVLTRFDPR